MRRSELQARQVEENIGGKPEVFLKTVVTNFLFNMSLTNRLVDIRRAHWPTSHHSRRRP
jgi:hypothetical protein